MVNGRDDRKVACCKEKVLDLFYYNNGKVNQNTYQAVAILTLKLTLAEKNHHLKHSLKQIRAQFSKFNFLVV